MFDDQGRKYFANHNENFTTWNDPRDKKLSKLKIRNRGGITPFLLPEKFNDK